MVRKRPLIVAVVPVLLGLAACSSGSSGASTDAGAPLTVTLGPKNLSAPLTHYDGDVFSWLAPGGNGDPPSAITFGGSGSGPTTTMDIELLVVPQLTRK